MYIQLINFDRNVMTVMLLQLFTKQPLHKKNKKQMHTNQPTNKTNNKNKEVVVVPGWSLREHLTLQPLRPVPLNHDAELQHQLGRTLQEGLQIGRASCRERV